MKQGIFSNLFGWVPDWLGFGLIILAGVLAIAFGGFVTPSAGLVAFGVAAIVSAILAWSTGARSVPQGNPLKKTFGGKVDNINDTTWMIIFGLFVIALLIRIFIS